MKYFLLVIFFLLSNLTIFSQDKIYLRDNQLIIGKIISVNNNSYFILSDKNDSLFIKSDNISLIQYENGNHLVITPEKESNKTNNKIYTAEQGWSIGTNILLPVDGTFGLGIDKRFNDHFSLKLNQAFKFFRYNYFDKVFNSTLLANHYMGKGKAKLISSIGINFNLSEGNYYPYPYELIDHTDFAYYPPTPFHTKADFNIPIGTGIYVDISKHCSFTAQMMFDIDISSAYTDIFLDLFNSGFTFSYKF